MIILTTKAVKYTLSELAEDKDRIDELIEKSHLLLTKLHERGVYHADISEENIMFDMEERAYIIDFGLSGYLSDIKPDNLEEQLDEYYGIDRTEITATDPASKIQEAEHLEIAWLGRSLKKA